MNEKKKQQRKQIPLRLSSSLYEDLFEWAEHDFRSVNGQIEYILNECVKKRKKRLKIEIDKKEEIDIIDE